MLQKFDTPPEWKQISEILEEIDVRNEIAIISFNPYKLTATTYIDEILTELEAINSVLPFNITFKTVSLFEYNKLFILEPSFHFNKYRQVSLRSTFYENGNYYFDILKFKNFCRTKHEEALKSGLRKEVWNDEIGTNLFGHSEPPGYFGGKGSNGWKYIALVNLLIDIYVSQTGIQLYRIAPFEVALSQGKLVNISSLLKSSNEVNNQAVCQFILRKLGISASDQEKK